MPGIELNLDEISYFPIQTKISFYKPDILTDMKDRIEKGEGIVFSAKSSFMFKII